MRVAFLHINSNKYILAKLSNSPITMATQVIVPNHGVKIGVDVSIPGGFTNIPDAAHNPHIIALANWAIDEHNKGKFDKLKLVRVICAESQVLPCKVTYHILFEAMHLVLKLPNMVYLATVVESGHCKKLVEFKPQEIGNAA